MNNMIQINRNLTRVALCAVALSSYAHASEVSVLIVKNTGSFIVKVEQILSQFFNASNSISYNECDISLGKALNDFINKLDSLKENATNDLDKKAYQIAQEARKHFNAAYGVIRQYNGKPASDAAKFKSDIERVFSPDTAFSTLSNMLRSLNKEAQEAGDEELMHVVQQLMLVLEKKKAEWNGKSKPSLLTGLTIRMCK